MAKTTKDNPAHKALEEQAAAQEKSNAEAMKRMDSSQPTPTQAENDLAKLGVAVDEKEDDGSGETVIERRVVANVPLGYETRSVSATPAAVKPKETKRDY